MTGDEPFWAAFNEFASRAFCRKCGLDLNQHLVAVDADGAATLDAPLTGSPYEQAVFLHVEMRGVYCPPTEEMS